MSSIDVVIAVVALALIAWELWFFLGRRPRSWTRQQAPAQEFRITVYRGFDPDLVLVEAGHPVRLHFYRGETGPQSDHVEFESLSINRPLAEFETTSVEFIPADPGDYCFRCGATCEGHVVAQVGGEAARANLGRGHQKHG